MKKINNALSNEVYLDEEKNIIVKKYILNEFKIYFGNQEDKALIENNIKFDVINKGLEIEYIDHKKKWNNNFNLQQNVHFIKWLKKHHSSISCKDLDYPGFEKTYYGLLIPVKKGLLKKKEFWKHEKGMVIDALKLLQQDNQVLLHNDLVEGNILIINEDEYKLIDYEYSGKGNYLFDIGSFLTERNLNKEEMIAIAQAYNSDINLDDLWIICSFLLVFWARWALYQYNKTHEIIYKEIYLAKRKKYNEVVEW